MAGSFIQFLKQVESLHQQGKSITTLIKCSKCQNNRRDVRILNCLHLYCHRCILTLRATAEKGDAVTGFRASCVIPGCPEVVSGKTAVLDSDIVEFLTWYDTQPAGIQHGPAQIQVMKAALDKTPDDEDVKAKSKAIKKVVDDDRMRGAISPPCDLIKIARLIRKPY